jgi:transposase
MARSYPTLIQESIEELAALQKGNLKAVVYQRLQLLRLLKSSHAKTLAQAASLIGVAERSMQRWWRQYQQAGLASLLVVRPTRHPRLSAEQQQSLLAEAGKGAFATIAQMGSWVEQSFGLHYTVVGMWKLASKLKIKKKTARPTHVKKDEQAVEHFKKTLLC